MGASVLPLILSNFAGGSKNSCGSEINSLSDRELEIFSFIGRGVSVSELATELHVSVKTIETHQMRMKEKLALHTAAELRQKAREWLAKSAVNRYAVLHNETDRTVYGTNLLASSPPRTASPWRAVRSLYVIPL